MKRSLIDITKNRLNTDNRYNYRGKIMERSVSPDQFRNPTKRKFLYYIDDVIVELLEAVKLIKKYMNPYINIKDDID